MASADHLAPVVQLPLCILDGLNAVESAFSINAGSGGEHGIAVVRLLEKGNCQWLALGKFDR